MSEFVFTILVFVLFLTVLLLIYNNISVVKKYSIKTGKIDRGFKIVLVSDFHNNKRLFDGIVRKIKKCEPDIIVVAGDLVDRRKPDFNTAGDFLNDLRSIAKVYYISGNHEAVIGLERIADQLDCSDIVLDEKYKIFDDFSILGLSDRIIDVNEKRRDLLSVFERLDNFKIAVVHRPVEFDRGLSLSNYDIDLVLCGHDHGGLIRIPFFGALYAPDEGFFPKYSKGKYTENGSTMIVSGGSGNTFLPLRLNNFPEIVSISVEN